MYSQGQKEMIAFMLTCLPTLARLECSTLIYLVQGSCLMNGVTHSGLGLPSYTN